MVKSRGWGNSQGNTGQNSRWNRAAEELKHDVRKELNYAMNDIRQKVVEHGWFQKQVTPDHSTHGFYHTDDLSPDRTEAPSQALKPSKFDEMYGQNYNPIDTAQEYDELNQAQGREQDGMDI